MHNCNISNLNTQGWISLCKTPQHFTVVTDTQCVKQRLEHTVSTMHASFPCQPLSRLDLFRVWFKEQSTELYCGFERALLAKMLSFVDDT